MPSRRTLWIVIAMILLPLAAGAQSLSEEPQMDRPGGDYTHFGTTELRECKRACFSDRRCRAYSFNSVNSICYLKDEVTKTSRDSRTISGVKEGYGEPGRPHYGERELTREPGFDYYGNDYTDFRARGVDSCREECWRDRRCAAYSFNNRSGLCYLKDRVGPLRRNRDTITGMKQRR
ncbi:MAG TPA: PAN domain-containing protein [Thermoanaerobaculia bacterium]|nr:PAN domain-containing protein [Thermoanaerobaculia bacterium]